MGARNSYDTRDRIEYGLQLVFDDEGGARMTRTPGKLAANERSMALTVSLPKAIFKRPALTATITVDDPHLSIPPIDIGPLQHALKDAFGADLLITVQQQEQPA